MRAARRTYQSDVIPVSSEIELLHQALKFGISWMNVNSAIIMICDKRTDQYCLIAHQVSMEIRKKHQYDPPRSMKLNKYIKLRIGISLRSTLRQSFLSSYR